MLWVFVECGSFGGDFSKFIRVSTFNFSLSITKLLLTILNFQRPRKRHVELEANTVEEDFLSQVDFDLVNIGKLTVASASKRGRPSSSTPPPKKRRTVGALVPEGESRYDQVGHFPTHSEKQNRCWFCQNGRSRWMCSNVEYTSAL